jgi:uncharacterized membrane protein
MSDFATVLGIGLAGGVLGFALIQSITWLIMLFVTRTWR